MVDERLEDSRTRAETPSMLTAAPRSLSLPTVSERIGNRNSKRTPRRFAHMGIRATGLCSSQLRVSRPQKKTRRRLQSRKNSDGS